MNTTVLAKKANVRRAAIQYLKDQGNGGLGAFCSFYDEMLPKLSNEQQVALEKKIEYLMQIRHVGRASAISVVVIWSLFRQLDGADLVEELTLDERRKRAAARRKEAEKAKKGQGHP